MNLQLFGLIKTTPILTQLGFKDLCLNDNQIARLEEAGNILQEITISL